LRPWLIGLLAWSLAGCANPPAPGTTAPTTTSSTASGSSSATPSASHLPGPVDHIFVVVEENHDYGQIVGNPSAAYLNELIGKGALATNAHAVAHPSLPNYLALVAGSTFGVTSDCAPTESGCHFPNVSLPDRLEAAGLTWRGYFEDMARPCGLENRDTYTVHHDPFIYFDRIAGNPQRCAAHVVPLGALSSDLATSGTTPNFALIVPGNAHNMHDGSVRAADTWLRDQLVGLFASPAWTDGRSLLVVTTDEADGSASNRILTFFYGPAARAGFRSDTAFTPYSLLRTVDDLLGVAPVAQDAHATSMRSLLR
jgi:acid phosphatase